MGIPHSHQDALPAQLRSWGNTYDSAISLRESYAGRQLEKGVPAMKISPMVGGVAVAVALGIAPGRNAKPAAGDLLIMCVCTSPFRLLAAPVCS